MLSQVLTVGCMIYASRCCGTGLKGLFDDFQLAKGDLETSPPMYLGLMTLGCPNETAPGFTGAGAGGRDGVTLSPDTTVQVELDTFTSCLSASRGVAADAARRLPATEGQLVIAHMGLIWSMLLCDVSV